MEIAQNTVSEQEKAIFSAVYKFYKTAHPVDITPEYWSAIMSGMNAISNQYKHPLMDQLLMAVYQYLNQKIMKGAPQ